jgi:hypothetical protein
MGKDIRKAVDWVADVTGITAIAEGIRENGPALLNYALSNGGKSAAQQDMDDLSGRYQGSKPTEVTIDGNKHPESARHAADAQKAGKPATVEVGDQGGKRGRRAEAMKGHPKVKGKDRDEYPPAWSKQGGRGASVRPISPGDNRGSGASMGNRTRGLKPGTKVKIKPVNVPE